MTNDQIVSTHLDVLTGEMVTTTIYQPDNTVWTYSDNTGNGIANIGSIGNSINYDERWKIECKEILLNNFSTLSKHQRERIINLIEDHDAMTKMIGTIEHSFCRVKTKEDTISEYVTIDELKSLHARLLIEEEIK